VILHLFDAVEVIPSKPFRPDSSVVPFDIGILLGLAWLDVDQPDPRLLPPVLKLATDIFRAITPSE